MIHENTQKSKQFKMTREVAKPKKNLRIFLVHTQSVT